MLLSRGRDGLDGEDGERGPEGRQGPRGFKGDIGPIGKRGPKGDNGRDGLNGKAGDRGPKGDKGDKGEKGERGPQGPTGPPPEHEWQETKLRFRKPDGDWGKAVDLKGPPGRGGALVPIPGLTEAEVIALIEQYAGSAQFTPTYIAPGETFTVPANKQVLYAIDIVNEGNLVVNGDLVRVPAVP